MWKNVDFSPICRSNGTTAIQTTKKFCALTSVSVALGLEQVWARIPDRNNKNNKADMKKFFVWFEIMVMAQPFRPLANRIQARNMEFINYLPSPCIALYHEKKTQGENRLAFPSSTQCPLPDLITPFALRREVIIKSCSSAQGAF